MKITIYNRNLFTILLFVFFFINSLGSNVQQICRPNNYDNLYQYLNQRWLNARKELKMAPVVKHTECDDKDRFCKSIKFYHDGMFDLYFKFTTQAVVWNINGTVIAYCRIFKCGNEGISNNINRYAREIDKYEMGKESIVLTHNGIKELKNAITNTKNDSFTRRNGDALVKFNLTPDFRARNKDFKMFTYVRNPLQHFESGLSEAIYRTNGLILNTTKDITDILRNFLNYGYIHDYRPKSINYHINHIFPMSGVFFNFDIDTILHLESFSTDWENVIVPTYNLPPKTYDLRDGFHHTAVNHPRITSNDPKVKDGRIEFYLQRAHSKNDRHLFKKFRKVERSGMRALCHLILIDYVCFPEYALPIECHFLNNTVLEGRRLLEKKKL